MQILVSNKSNTNIGEIVAIVDDSHVWSQNETLKAWTAAGNSSADWKRHFSLVIVTDKTLTEMEWLRDPLLKEVDGELDSVGPKYHFMEPALDSQYYEQMLTQGEVSAPWAFVEPYLVERT